MVPAGINPSTQNLRAAGHKGAWRAYRCGPPFVRPAVQGLRRPRAGPSRRGETPLRRITSIAQDACMSTTGESARRTVTAATGVAP
ncbi:hypothetical protein GCM10010293_44340 [Streptomyces griseoflavus]|nr:hypothetical protein GCM10010293_44340 [Streptomyces griseoflavus]